MIITGVEVGRRGFVMSFHRTWPWVRLLTYRLKQ